MAEEKNCMSHYVVRPSPIKLAFIGCWYKNDMYSHNCSNLVESLRESDVDVNVITSKCRCFTAPQHFSRQDHELINRNCHAIWLPYAPASPSKRYGLMRFYSVKVLRLDIWFGMVRGFLYFWQSRRSDLIHFDQVLEAFGALPVLVVIGLSAVFGRRIVVNVHEIDPVQRKHSWINHFYSLCSEVLVYSESMKRELVRLGARAERIRVIRYGVKVQELRTYDRNRYIYFGGHHILSGKGYRQLVDALASLKKKGHGVSILIYVGHGCDGLNEAKAIAAQAGVASVLEWTDSYKEEDLAEAYQRSRACLIPYTGGSARHPITCAMANATPVIATKAIDIPEYLGDLGIYVDGTAESIAEAIESVERGEHDLSSIGQELRRKAMEELDHSNIAQTLKDLYGQIAAREKLVQITPAGS